MVLLQEQNQCRATHKALRCATQCDPLLLFQPGLCWPSGLCFRLSTIYCRPLLDDLTWPLLTGAVWTAARLKTAVQRMGLCMTDRLQTPHRVTKKPGQTNICAWSAHTHTYTQRILEPVEPPGQTSWWHRFWTITASDADSSKGKQTNTPRGALHKQPRLLLFRRH